MERSPSSPQPDTACAVPCPGHDRPDPLTEARRLIAEDEQARMRACAAEIEQTLARYGMRLDVTQPQISITPVTGDGLGQR